MNVLIKAATLVVPENLILHLKKRDIYIKNGKIFTIAKEISDAANAQIVSRENLHVSVGWFDSGVAFGEPGFEERETLENGLDVAGKSGFTDVVLNTNTQPNPDSSSAIVYLKERSANKSTSLHPLGNLTVKGEGKTLAELYDMHQAGAVGFYDFKSPLSHANLIKIALEYAQNFSGLVFAYPTDQTIQGSGVAHEGSITTKLGLKGIPALAEELQIERDLSILEYTGGKLHIPTISTAGAVKRVASAKAKGLDVTCSVAIHNLLLTDCYLEDFDSRYKLMPPLRTKTDTHALQKAVIDGTIDFITTDHTPINIEEKKIEFDNAEYGTIGLESAFGALNAIFGMEKSISLLTKGRNRFGLEEIELKEGAMANLTLFNPERQHIFTTKNIRSTSKNSAFINTTLQGKVYGVINNGKVNLL